MPWKKLMAEKDMFQETLNYLYRELKANRIAMGRAEVRKGITLTELVNLQTKADVLDGLVELVLKSYNIEDIDTDEEVAPVDDLDIVEG